MAVIKGGSVRPYQVNGAMLGGLEVSNDGVFENLPVAASASSQTGSLNSTYFTDGTGGGNKSIIHAINHVAVTQGSQLTSLSGLVNTNTNDLTNIKASNVSFTAGAGLGAISDVIDMDKGSGQTVSIGVDRVLQDLDDLPEAPSGKMIYSDSSGSFAYSDISAAGRALIDDADAAAQRTTLGLVIGTNVQAYDQELAALAGLTSAADKGIQFTGDGTAAVYDLTAAGKALLDDADAAAQRTTLGLVIGTNVQAYDQELAALAGLTSAANKVPMFSGDGTATVIDFKDEDNMASNSATAVPSQQSVKAYVDAQVATHDQLSELTDVNLEGTIAAGEFLVYDATNSKWENGVVSGDVVFSYDEAGAITSTIQANSVALATDTTGDFVASVTAGTGLTSTGATSGENISHSLSVDASQTQITAIGTITTGVWNGSVIGSAYLDADTMHLGVAQSVSAAKTFAAGTLKIVGTAADGTSAETYTVEIDGGILKLNPA